MTHWLRFCALFKLFTLFEVSDHRLGCTFIGKGTEVQNRHVFSGKTVNLQLRCVRYYNKECFFK